MSEPKTTLEDLKQIEQSKKKRVLAKALSKIKDNARAILEAKEGCSAILRTLKINDKESKQIIDWVNSLVELSDADKEKISENAKSIIKSLEDDTEKSASKAIDNWYTTYPQYFNLGSPTTSSTNALFVGGSMSTTSMAMSCTANGFEVK